MDVWSWVYPTQRKLREAGHGRLAYLMHRVSSASVNGQGHEVEAIVAEGLPLARAANEPWVEVFLRHWRLQSRLFVHFDASHGVGEAIELLDFAHGPKTAECPQSVCATQDVAHAYALIDGPGYATECLAACDETLARINRSWPCWSCIGSERGSALMDARRFEDALAFSIQEIDALTALGKDAAVFYEMRVDALQALGRYEEALSFADRCDRGTNGKTGAATFALMKALCLARTGKVAEARALMPAVTAMESMHYALALRLFRELATRGEGQHAAAHLAWCAQRAGELDVKGAHHDAVLAARVTAETALALNEPSLAQLLLREARLLATELRAPARELERIAALEQRCGDATPLSPTHALSTQIELQLHRSTRASVEALTPIARKDASLFQDIADLLLTSPTNLLDAWLRDAGAGHPKERLWIELRMATTRRDLERTERALVQLEALDPTSGEVRFARAQQARRQGDGPRALSILRELGGAESTEPHVLWESALAAALARDHAYSREVARALGFRFDGEGPIDQPFEHILVARRDANGQATNLLAVRISPVTARIVAWGKSGTRSPRLDVVLISPTAIADAGEHAADQPRYTHAELAVLSSRAMRFDVVAGLRTQESASPQRLVDALMAQGIEVTDISQQDATWCAPHQDVFFHLLSPETLGAETLKATLEAHALEPGWALVWESVLASLGDEEGITALYERQDQLLPLTPDNNQDAPDEG